MNDKAGGSAANKPSRNRRRRAKSVDLWRPVPELDPPAPIVHAGDPATMLRSLGDPPMHGHSVTAGHYLAAVVERAAGLAVALAATADLLERDRPEDDDVVPADGGETVEGSDEEE